MGRFTFRIMKKVLITGGTGLIGSHLTPLLTDAGYQVMHLSRNPSEADMVPTFGWDPGKGTIDKRPFEHLDAIIHLAGAGIADERWTDSRRKIIIDSRVETAKLLFKTVVEEKTPLNAFISASGINYYGTQTTEHIFKEDDPPSTDFIGECCRLWEEAALEFQDIARVVMLRTGVVLSQKGGALERIAKPVRYGVGAPLGKGTQYVPYIHIEDLCRMYIHALESEIKGPFNAVNGDHITNEALTKEVANQLNKPLLLPNVPAFALKLVFGEMANIILEGSRASAEKIQSSGFEFEYSDLPSTLRAIYG
jgi:hypothetical protein